MLMWSGFSQGHKSNINFIKEKELLQRLIFKSFSKEVQKHHITVPKTKEILREAQTNYEKGIEVKVALEKLRKKRLSPCFSTKSLRWILRISLWLKHSSPCGGPMASNDSLWWPAVVVGGGEECVRVWVGVWREEEWKIVFFTLKNVFIIYRFCLASSSH